MYISFSLEASHIQGIKFHSDPHTSCRFPMRAHPLAPSLILRFGKIMHFWGITTMRTKWDNQCSLLMLGYETHDSYEMVSKSKPSCSHSPHGFQSSYEYLSHCQIEYSHACQMVTKFLPNILIIEPRLVIIF